MNSVNDILVSCVSLLEQAEKDYARINYRKKELRDKLEIYSKSISLCDLCLANQIDLRRYIEKQVTALLRSVFFYKYSFRFDAISAADGVTLRGLKPRLTLGDREGDPSSFGAGVQNVVSFALRLVFLLLTPSLEKVMVLDEPWVNVNANKWPRILEFIESLQRHFDFQLIVITHIQAEFPHAINVYSSGTGSKVEVICG